MRELRRTDCKVTDFNVVLSVLQKCQHCHLAFVDEGQPYVVALNYGFSSQNEKITLYFHSAVEGRKLDLVRTGKSVAFAMECEESMDTSDEFACKFTTHYLSVLGVGTPRMIDEAEKLDAFANIMTHYTDKKLEFNAASLARTKLFAIDVESFSCKKH